MSRTHLTATIVALAGLSLTASSAWAQFSFSNPPVPALQPEYRSPKTSRAADRLEQYRMRKEAAEAIAAAQRANAMLAVAAKIGRYEAANELRLAQAANLEVRVSTSRRKLDALKDLAPVNAERFQLDQQQADARNQKRIQAGLAHVKQVRQGEWPQALLDESFRPLRDELTLAIGGRPDFVAGGEQINWQYAAQVAGQMREQLRGRVRDLPQPDYAKALRFLEELKVMGIESVVGDQT